MMQSIGISALLVMACASTVPASAGVVNEAQRNGPQRIAPGSIILISAGVTVGPSIPQMAQGFPLVTNLADTSVRIVVDGVSVNAYVLATESRWVRALVPSNTPLGDGRLIVTFNGQESPPDLIHIAERGFAIFDGTYTAPGSLAPSFTFPRAVQNVSLNGSIQPNSLANSVTPGEFVVLWGTGLGAASGDERASPVPGNLSLAGLTVFVGDKPARVVYAGRSDCCAGMDQVIIEVPPGIEGCSVPVWVRYSDEGHGSNEVYLSIKSGGGACSDPHGLSEGESLALSAGNLRVAQIHALPRGDRVQWMMRFGTAANGRRIPLASCAQAGWGTGPFAIDVTAALDAGTAIKIQSARATFQAERRERNVYTAELRGPLDPGEYTIENETAGSEVGPFSATVSVPPQPQFTWSNREDLNSVNMADGLTVKWTGGDPAGYVVIGGQFEAGGETWGNGGFVCHEQADKGTFTIPPALLVRLASDWLDRPTYPGANSLRMWVGHTISKRFHVPGFGIGEFQVDDWPDASFLKTVTLRP